MAKNKIASETETKQGETTELSDCFSELFSIEKILKTWVTQEAEPDSYVLLLLTRAAIKKLDYFQKKYGFQVEHNDHFYVENLFEFAQKLPAETE